MTMTTKTKFNLALIQHAFKGSKEATIAHTAAMVRSAAKNGANLVALQELHTSEYFCQSEDVAFLRYADGFERDCEFFGNLAKECGVVLVASLFERRAKGLYHNTAVVFEKDGAMLGKYRKMHIPDDPAFYEKFYFTPGDLGFCPIQTSLGRLGVLVCWDQWFPEAARLMALRGADILLYPTAIGFDPSDSEAEKSRQKEAWIAVQRGHAVANGIFVAAINRVGFEAFGESCGARGESCESRESKSPESAAAQKSGGESSKTSRHNESKSSESAPRGIDFWGGSFVFGPQGEAIAAAKTQNDEIITAEIDLARITQVRDIWPFLRDRRIDFYGDLTKRFID